MTNDNDDRPEVRIGRLEAEVSWLSAERDHAVVERDMALRLAGEMEGARDRREARIRALVVAGDRLAAALTDHAGLVRAWEEARGGKA